jgi:carbamoyltransferase
MIKMRDFRMPFAPTMLEEYASTYLLNRDSYVHKVKESAYYMISAFDSTDIAQQHLRASIHQKDKTLRPQLVSEQSNTWMYTMLKEYEKMT